MRGMEESFDTKSSRSKCCLQKLRRKFVLGVWQELNVVMYDLEIRLVSTFFLLFGLKPFDLFTLFYINARTAILL